MSPESEDDGTLTPEHSSMNSLVCGAAYSALGVKRRMELGGTPESEAVANSQLTSKPSRRMQRRL